jgi:hypothetical protein
MEIMGYLFFFTNLLIYIPESKNVCDARLRKIIDFAGS